MQGRCHVTARQMEGAHVILIGLFARCNLSQALRAEPPPRLLSRIFAPISRPTTPPPMMSTAMSEEQIRSVIQGPVDVEWRCVPRIATPKGSRASADRPPPADTRCGASARRFSPACCSAPSSPPSRSPPSRASASRTCPSASPSRPRMACSRAPQRLHPRCEGGVLCASALPRAFQVHDARRRGQRGAEPHPPLPRVRPSRAAPRPCGLLTASPSAKGFIDQAISQGGRVLVHCNGELLPMCVGARAQLSPLLCPFCRRH